MPIKEVVKSFLDDPIDFMSKNILLPHSRPQSRKYWFTFTFEGTGKRWDGEIANVYALAAGQEKGAGSFPAFWCKYQPEQTCSVMVTAEADLMFTATMSGCSLGVGSKTPEGGRLVSHANCGQLAQLIGSYLESNDQQWKIAAMRAAQQALQHASLLQEQKNDLGMEDIAPPRYLFDDKETEELDSTTFGVRDPSTDEWAFYTQKRIRDQKLVALAFVAGTWPQEKVSLAVKKKNSCVLM